jgi:plasmid stabilization system protein ParE
MIVTKVRFSRLATHDIAEIGAYIAKDNANASKDFISRIREKCRSFSAAPLIGRKCEEFGEGVRIFPFGNYLISTGF